MYGKLRLLIWLMYTIATVGTGRPDTRFCLCVCVYVYVNTYIHTYIHT